MPSSILSATCTDFYPFFIMQIKVNGKPQEFSDGITLSELLEQVNLGSKRVAVERNGTIVPRSRHTTQTLEQGDCIEIVHAIGGGQAEKNTATARAWHIPNIAVRPDGG